VKFSCGKDKRGYNLIFNIGVTGCFLCLLGVKYVLCVIIVEFVI
jgi:hypothetical protein